MTSSIHGIIRSTPLTPHYRPVELEWDVAGDMPHALKDGVACWFGPAPGRPEGEVVIAGGLWPTGIAHEPGSQLTV